jgi:hypothetical protein
MLLFATIDRSPSSRGLRPFTDRSLPFAFETIASLTPRIARTVSDATHRSMPALLRAEYCRTEARKDWDGISLRSLAIRRHLIFNHLRPTVSLRSLAVRVSDTERPPSSPGVIFGYAALSDTVGQEYFIGRHRKRLDEGRTNQGNGSSVSVRQYERTTPGRIEKATDSGDPDEVARGTSGLSASRSVEDVPGSRKSDFRGQGPQGAPRLRTTASPGIRADRGFRAVAVAVVASISTPCLESLSSEHNRQPGETANVMDRGNRSCRREYHKRLASARLRKNRQPFRGSELIIHDRACC